MAIIIAFEAGKRSVPAGTSFQSPRGRYSLHEFRPKSLIGGMSGVEENELFKINESTGETWQLSMLNVPIGLVLDNGKPATQRVTGWEPVAQDYDRALQETWIKYGTPVPKKN